MPPLCSWTNGVGNSEAGPVGSQRVWSRRGPDSCYPVPLAKFCCLRKRRLAAFSYSCLSRKDRNLGFQPARNQSVGQTKQFSGRSGRWLLPSQLQPKTRLFLPFRVFTEVGDAASLRVEMLAGHAGLSCAAAGLRAGCVMQTRRMTAKVGTGPPGRGWDPSHLGRTCICGGPPVGASLQGSAEGKREKPHSELPPPPNARTHPPTEPLMEIKRNRIK